MKYTIARQFSLTNKKYDVICNGKIAATVKTSHSKQYQNQYKYEIIISSVDFYRISFVLVWNYPI